MVVCVFVGLLGYDTLRGVLRHGLSAYQRVDLVQGLPHFIARLIDVLLNSQYVWHAYQRVALSIFLYLRHSRPSHVQFGVDVHQAFAQSLSCVFGAFSWNSLTALVSYCHRCRCLGLVGAAQTDNVLEAGGWGVHGLQVLSRRKEASRRWRGACWRSPRMPFGKRPENLGTWP